MNPPASDTRSDCFGCWVVGWPSGTKPVPEPVWILGDCWTLNYKELGASERPCWVMQSKRHLLDLSGANQEELLQFGPALAAASQAIQEACEAERVYVQVTNLRGHYHLDLVPYYQEDPAIDAQTLALHPAPPGVIRRKTADTMQLMQAALQRQEHIICRPL